MKEGERERGRVGWLGGYTIVIVLALFFFLLYFLLSFSLWATPIKAKQSKPNPTVSNTASRAPIQIQSPTTDTPRYDNHSQPISPSTPIRCR